MTTMTDAERQTAFDYRIRCRHPGCTFATLETLDLHRHQEKAHPDPKTDAHKSRRSGDRRRAKARTHRRFPSSEGAR